MVPESLLTLVPLIVQSHRAPVSLTSAALAVKSPSRGRCGDLAIILYGQVSGFPERDFGLASAGPYDAGALSH
jgi:hypothetical protein